MHFICKNIDGFIGRLWRTTSVAFLFCLLCKAVLSTAQTPLQVGQVDPLFNPQIDVEQIDTVAAGEDDTLYVAGKLVVTNGNWKSTGIAKLNRDGSINTNFSVKLSDQGYIRSILVLPDGKLYIGGLFTSVDDQPRGGIARLMPDGKLDPTFDTISWINAGYYLPPQWGLQAINRLRLEPDGNLLIASVNDFNPGTFAPGNSIARVFPDGRKDSAYDPKLQPRPFAYRQNDGRELYRDTFSLAVPYSYRYYDYAVFRKFPDGTPDPSFPAPIYASSPITRFTALTLLPDDSIMVARDKFLQPELSLFPVVVTNTTLMRWNRDGKIDTNFPPLTNFGAYGSYYQAEADVIHIIYYLPGGDLIIAGRFFSVGGFQRSGLARIHGEPIEPVTSEVKIGLVKEPGDQTVKLGDRVTMTCSAYANAPITFQWQHDGTNIPGATNDTLVLVSAKKGDAGNYQVEIKAGDKVVNSVSARLTVLVAFAGRVDASFDPGAGADGAISTLELQLDGKILIGGAFTNFNGVLRPGIARLMPDGSLDASFDPGAGFRNLRGGTGTTANVVDFLVQPDGKIVAAGSFTAYQDTAVTNLVRLLPDGALDKTFVLNPAPQTTLAISSITREADGHLLIAGNFNYFGTNLFEPVPAWPAPYTSLVRVNGQGRLDSNFRASYTGWVSGGPPFFSKGPSTFPISGVRVRQNGQIVVVGNIPGGVQVVASSGGVASTMGLVTPREVRGAPGYYEDAEPIISDMAISSDGTVYFTGTFYTKENNLFVYKGPIGRGTNNLDSAWSGLVKVDPSGYLPSHLTLNSRDQLVINGIVSGLGGGSNTIARFNADGSRDKSFDLGPGPDGIINILAAQPNGDILVAGDFKQIGGMSRQRIARMHDAVVFPGAGGELRLRDIVREGNEFHLSIETQAGATHVLEYADTLTSSIWKQKDSVVGDGSIKVLRDREPVSPQRFYRIRTE